MLIAEARVETERSSRYLVQLCRHVNKAAQASPQMHAHIEWSDDRGVISFGWGRCTLRADPGVLTLRAEAPDEESLQRIEHRVAERLERFGRRDHLTVTWTPAAGAGEQLPRQPPRPTQEDMHMADPPRYPDARDDTGVGPDRGSTTGTTRWQKVVGIIGLVVALWVGIEMYNVVVGDFGGGPSPGGHGPGGGGTPIETPAEDQEREIDTEDDGGHDPSEFDHG